MNQTTLTTKTILITGAAGFIGSNLVLELLKTALPVQIVGIDNLNDYYDVRIKEWRLEAIAACAAEHEDSSWTFVKGSIANRALVDDLFDTHHPDIVVNLAAQAGVRYSITNPDVYIENNLIGFYNIPSTGLRFFTVYGPAGRPDMAYFGFTNKLLAGETIEIFNYGNCKRDFTFVDDIVEGVKRVMQSPPAKETGEDGLPIPPYAVYNIGNNQPVNLLDFVDILQQELIWAEVLPADYDFEGHKKLVAMQPGDVPITYADTSALERDFGFKPSTSLREGLRAFARWYKEFYKI